MPHMSQPPSQSQSAVGTPSLLTSNQPQQTFDNQTSHLDTTGDDLLDLDVEMSGMTNADEKTDDWVVVDEQAGAQQSSNNPPSNTNNTNTNEQSMGQSSVDVDVGSMFDSVPDFTADFGGDDSAGDALADFTQDDNMGLGDLVDDSAFGDAFHEEMGGDGNN
jgi:hypothetical protein